MPTDLERFQHAYASVTVATYQPLVLRWVSGWTLENLASTMAWRAQKALRIGFDGTNVTAAALNAGRLRAALPDQLGGIPTGRRQPPSTPVDNFGNPLVAADVQPVPIDGYPDAVMVGDKVYLTGVVDVQNSAENINAGAGFMSRFFGWLSARSAASVPVGKPNAGVRNVPSFVAGQLGTV